MTKQRFEIHSDGIGYEPARDLYWTADDVTDGPVSQVGALAAVTLLLNEKVFGGFADWRLPTVEELFLLADRTRSDPSIDTEFFPACKCGWYWTDTDDESERKNVKAGHSYHAWMVGFYDGSSRSDYRHYGIGHCRAVRGPGRKDGEE